MAATQVQRPQGHYFKVLENHKKRLGDYEQMHFRKSIYEVLPCVNNDISLAPRRTSRPQLVPFDKNTAATYLRQTESQWLMPSLSRQEAAKLLFNKPTGTFVVRNSQKARYALSLRMPVDDPAVSHFLIQTNQQNFLTIQGSNLPFLSIFDLLAYFCFNQSGGMPCCLKAPVNQIQEDSSDSSDSEGDESLVPDPHPYSYPLYSSAHDHTTSAHSPQVPPRDYPATSRSTSTDTRQTTRQKHTGSVHEEIFIDQVKQESYMKSWQSQDQSISPHDWLMRSPVRSIQGGTRSQGCSPNVKKKRVPPPKPPRTDIPPDYELVQESTDKERVELYKSARRVSGIVDMDVTQLYTHAVKKKQPASITEEDTNSPKPDSSDIRPRSMQWRKFSPPNGPIPIPSVVHQKSDSFETTGDKKRTLSSAKSVDSIVQTKPGSPKVSSLIQMFESKSPTSSPPLEKRSPPVIAKWTPPSPRRRSDAIRQKSPNPESKPSRPPKPQPPPIPPKPLLATEENTPVLPPRTPAPLLPPKPPGSKPPVLRPRSVHRRSLSDSQPISFNEDGMMEGSPRVPPKHKWNLPDDRVPPTAPPTSQLPGDLAYEPVGFNGPDQLIEKLNNIVVNGQINRSDRFSNDQGNQSKMFDQQPSERDIKGWTMVVNEMSGGSTNTPVPTTQQEESVEVSGTTGTKSSGLKWKPKPPGWAKKLKFPRKPRKRIRKFITELAADPGQEFGKRINEFITEMRSKSTEPHQKMLSEIRNFISVMHEFLLEHHKQSLINCGMESCDNFGHVVETTLQQLILHPLSHYIYLRIEEYYSQNGFLFQVQRSIHQGKLKQPEEMGIRKNLIVPGDKAISELTEVFSRMMKTPCAISKLEYLLEAVRLTYEHVRDVKQPKKAMNDLGADDFLPLFVWVLVQCGFYRAEIEAEYMWGLAHPSLFNGEGGYYLTTLTSAVNVLKELSQSPAQPPVQLQQLPAMNEMQTELKVYCEDEHTGQYSTAFYLPIVPTMTAAEICDIIANRRRIPTPEKYALFKVINGKSTMIGDKERPQEIKLQWTLDRNAGNVVNSSSAYQPSSRFIAYKLRMTM